MSRRVVLAAFLLAGGLCPAASVPGHWTLAPQDGRWHLVLVRSDVIADARRTMALADGEVEERRPQWRVRRDAGLFLLERTDAAGGRFRFEPDPGYVERLRAVASNWWDAGAVFDLAVLQVPRSHWEKLPPAGAPLPRVAELVRYSPAAPPPPAALEEGMRTAYLRAVRQTGYPLFAPDAERLQAHGVSAEWLRQMKASGLDALSVTDMIRLQSHGVTSQDIQFYQARGRTHLSVDEIVRLKVNGID